MCGQCDQFSITIFLEGHLPPQTVSVGFSGTLQKELRGRPWGMAVSVLWTRIRAVVPGSASPFPRFVIPTPDVTVAGTSRSARTGQVDCGHVCVVTRPGGAWQSDLGTHRVLMPCPPAPPSERCSLGGGSPSCERRREEGRAGLLKPGGPRGLTWSWRGTPRAALASSPSGTPVLGRGGWRRGWGGWFFLTLIWT